MKRTLFLLLAFFLIAVSALGDVSSWTVLKDDDFVRINYVDDRDRRAEYIRISDIVAVRWGRLSSSTGAYVEIVTRVTHLKDITLGFSGNEESQAAKMFEELTKIVHSTGARTE